MKIPVIAKQIAATVAVTVLVNVGTNLALKSIEKAQTEVYRRRKHRKIGFM